MGCFVNRYRWDFSHPIRNLPSSDRVVVDPKVWVRCFGVHVDVVHRDHADVHIRLIDLTLSLVASSLKNGPGPAAVGPDYSPQNKISKISFYSHRFNHGDNICLHL